MRSAPGLHARAEPTGRYFGGGKTVTAVPQKSKAMNAPDTADLDEAGRTRFFGHIEAALKDKPPALRCQFDLFLFAVRWLPALRYGAPLDRLVPEKQDAALKWFHNGPIALLRQGFWGMKTLIFMGYYGQVELQESFGYRPSKDGLSQLHVR